LTLLRISVAAFQFNFYRFSPMEDLNLEFYVDMIVHLKIVCVQ